MDDTDLQIVECLKRQARMQWRDIGRQVHLSGQAVALRVRQLEKNGIIQGYTALVDERAFGNHVTAFITVIMKSADHKAFLIFTQTRPEIAECHRISGDGCYLLKVLTKDQDALARFLDHVLCYGNYRVSLSLGAIAKIHTHSSSMES